MNPARDYRAVLIEPGARCCLEAQRSAGERFLMREAPRLPLSGCTASETCACRYRKVDDRRGGDRRQAGVWDTTRWFGGQNHRSGSERRLGR